MNTLIPLALCTMSADPNPGPPVDTSFLRLYAETRGFMLGRPAKPKITPDGKAVLFLRSGPKSPKQSLFAFDVATKQTKELLSPEALLGGADENLTPEERARRERQRVTAGGFADYYLDKDGERVLVSLSGRLFVFDRGTGKAKELKTGGGVIDPKWSPDGAKVAYVRGYDVYVYDLAADKESAVTTGGTREKTHGLAEFVAQEEMDRHTGYWWSPDGKQIAYAEADHAGVEVWHIADPLKPDAPPQPQYYPRPGKKNVSVRLGVVRLNSVHTIWVEWDRKKYEYLAAVRWSDTVPFTVLVQDRKQQELALLTVGPDGRTTTRGVAETDPAWVNIPPDVPQAVFTAGGFLWVGESSGELVLQHLGNDWKPRAAVKLDRHRLIGLAGVTSVTGTTTAYSYVAPNPTEQHVWRHFGAAGGWFPGSDPTQLTHEPGMHTAVVVPTSREPAPLVVTSTTLKSLPVSRVRLTDDGQPVADLPAVALEPDFKPNVAVEKVGDYWTAVVRPRSFDPAKKYPVIVDVYGGPRHLHVVQAMRNWLVPQWLADQGFVVVAVDNRGTPGRGRDWERAVYQKFGTVPLDDQVWGLLELGRKHPELDLDRVGIVGWSFGGYMAANGVLRRPDVFKAAVAGAPVTDWEDYDTHYTERYLGLLPESRKAYDEASLIPLAKDLKRPLLLVHGTADDNVYYRHTLKLTDALFRAGRPFETLPLPGVTHMYTADPQVTERLWERAVTFFRMHLGGAK
jgi:dipeptidyl-peptidase 4